MEENKFVQMAVENFRNGFSCSESIAKAAYDIGYTDFDLTSVATSFSGGIGTGCLCGAVSGAELVLGALFGKNKTNTARAFAKEFIEEFKKIHKATCCRILTKGFDFHSKERKDHCTNMVATCALILDKIVQRELVKA